MVARSLVINRNSWAGNGSNRFTYQLPSHNNFTQQECAITYASINNQMFNITAALGNNFIIVNWPLGVRTTILAAAATTVSPTLPTPVYPQSGTLDNGVNTTSLGNIHTSTQILNLTNPTALTRPTAYKCLIPDGRYTVGDINGILQNFMYNNGLYYIEASTGNILYYIEIVRNSKYSVDINSTTIPFDDITGAFTKAFNGPTTSITWKNLAPTITFPAALGVALGFQGSKFYSPTSYVSPDTQTLVSNTTAPILFQIPPTPFNTISQTFSNNTYPQMSNTTTIIMGCSLVNQFGIAPNQNSMASVAVSDTQFGWPIIYQPQIPEFLPIQNNSHSEISIYFYDQDGSPITIIDPDILITLVIRDDDDEDVAEY